MSVIDFHTHVLPGIDDGSKSVSDSVLMLRREAQQGIKKVIATPHFYANYDVPEKFLQNRTKAKESLLSATKYEQDLPEVTVGAEVYFFEGISDCEYLRYMSVEGTDCVMVEMPMKQWSDRNLQELVGIRQKQHLTPIIAHADRYVNVFNAKKIIKRLSQLPVIIQVNASFFTRPATKRTALSLLKEGRIHLIGSDCHNLDTRPPNVDTALSVIERALGHSAIEHFNRMESKILGK